MNYLVKSMAPIIEANYNNFTQVEKNIADFFLNNQTKMDFSAKNVSEKIFVSEASLSRFAKKCGFRGYREFVYQYEETFVERKESVNNSTRTVLSIYQELLNKTYNLMDEAQIIRIVKDLYEAERVVACGKGSSGLAASEMESRFMRIGVDIDSVQDTDLMRMQAMFQGKGRLVFGISISGETEEVLYMLKEACKRGARTVLITANNNDLFSQFCSEVVLVPTVRQLNRGNQISPQFPILVMMDIIYYYYVNQDKDSKELLHDSTMRALTEGKHFRRMPLE
jgi:DNA-binding MurR/RpiR family transcriptional regulator